MIRLFLAWRLLRFLAPLLLCEALAVAVIPAARAREPSASRRRSPRPSSLGRGVWPIVTEACRDFAHILAMGLR